MPNLNTARGTIDTADLGVTLMHEHVFIMTTEILLNYPEAWGDESKRIAGAVARLNELKSRGVDTIVDLRRYLSLSEGALPGTAGTSLQNMQRAGNPWGLAAADRLAWTEGLDVPRLQEGSERAPFAEDAVEVA